MGVTGSQGGPDHLIDLADRLAPQPRDPQRALIAAPLFGIIAAGLAAPAAAPAAILLTAAAVAAVALALYAAWVVVPQVVLGTLIRRHWARHGFVPVERSRLRPAGVPVRLWRLELSSRGRDLQLALERWSLDARLGWRREVLERHLVDADDPLTLGTVRAELQMRAERAADADLLSAGERHLFAAEAEERAHAARRMAGLLGGR